MVRKDLEDRINGDTFEKVVFSFYGETSETYIDLTGATATCQFRRDSQNGDIQTELTIGSGLTLSDAEGGKLEIDQIDVLDWPPGIYYYDIEILLSDGRTKTYVGGTVNVLNSTTKK